MIKYIKKIDDGSSLLVKFNTETQDIDTISNVSTYIDWIWVVDEDGEFNNESVSAGDLIIRMYSINYKTKSNEFFIVRDSKLKEFYKGVLEYKKTQREVEHCDDCGCNPA